MAKARSINIDEAVEGLMNERKILDETISSLLRLKEARGGQRGRPPNWMVKARALQVIGEGRSHKRAEDQ